MAVVNYSFARQNLAKLMDEVEQDCAPIFITRQRKRGGAVLVSQAEWESIQETLYLVRNPKDAQDLRDAIAELDAGKGIEHNPLETAKSTKGAARGRRR
jgi:antitoxin YefM